MAHCSAYRVHGGVPLCAVYRFEVRPSVCCKQCVPPQFLKTQSRRKDQKDPPPGHSSRSDVTFAANACKWLASAVYSTENPLSAAAAAATTRKHPKTRTKCTAAMADHPHRIMGEANLVEVLLNPNALK